MFLFCFRVVICELVFVYVIVLVGVVFVVICFCVEGIFIICGCDLYYKGLFGEGWKWGGCSEDVDFGVLVFREFVDVCENRLDVCLVMNKYNNEVGCMIILDYMYFKCKCYGLLGSCEVKICWWV